MMNQFGIILPNWMKWLVFLVVCLIVSTTIGYFIGLDKNRKGLNTVLLSNVKVRLLDERMLLF